jgi:regulator of telomere elongation helicase 1
MLRTAQVVFMPYNYLVDFQRRKALEEGDASFSIRDAIIVFDEAHNIESVAMEAASFQISARHLERCAFDLQSCIDKSGTSMSRQLYDDFVRLKRFVLNFERILDVPSEVCENGDYIFKIFERLQVTTLNYVSFIHSLERIIDYLGLKEDFEMVSDPNSYTPLESLKSAILVAFSSRREIQHFGTHLFQSQPHEKNGVLDFWCFSPSIAFKEIAQQAKSIILTSGTLSPLQTLEQEMSISFQVKLENPHVVESSQILCQILTKGPGGTSLNSAFKNRDSNSVSPMLHSVS